MKIYNVTDERFKAYGKVVKDIDFSEMVRVLKEETPIPEDVAYVPGLEALESLPAGEELSRKVYGEMPIQIGYCNGHNSLLNALEYHKSSEINVAATDAILLVGKEQDITEDFTYDTALAEAFLLPQGMAVEMYATTLHYAPCGVDGAGFQVAIVLPKGTNLDLEESHEGGEDGHLTAKNKWLLGHPEGGLPQGSPMGLVGKNLCVTE
ncbi:MAG: DUF4867 family protein [Lachnospiraceae bacterium]|jgi:hypothetical protein|nr:DUF4867 family protein [Lachnospiraceae bacterium]MCI9097396.1 DUF4867 family protein [Lachnospiraceae bacterium]MCI9202546.1 DUF4867 family protein [Lachnospiraceae bacterium]MCI9335223.1 DUF4867 family protein [Lachnospiraceae bacterium]